MKCKDYFAQAGNSTRNFLIYEIKGEKSITKRILI